MRAPWAEPPKIVALTGAGLSRESGFAPFAADTMPAGLRLEDVVTGESFARDPERVHEFYNLRRRELFAAKPNAAHEALGVLDMVRAGEVLIVTANIDDLHERAGSKAVIHLHGELLKARCTICGRVSERIYDITAMTECPICSNAGHLRPHVVWVGEEPLRLATVFEALTHCRLFLAIGANVANEPASLFLADAKRAGARTIEFARDPSPASADFAERHHGPLIETVPDWVKGAV